MFLRSFIFYSLVELSRAAPPFLGTEEQLRITSSDISENYLDLDFNGGFFGRTGEGKQWDVRFGDNIISSLKA